MAGLVGPSKGQLISCAEDGRWGECLEILGGLDMQRYRRDYIDDYCKSRGDEAGEDSKDYDIIITPLERVVSLTHEMTILELGDKGEFELAYATLRMCSEMLDKTLPVHGDDVDSNDFDLKQNNNETNLGMMSSRSADIERRITALSSLRVSGRDTSNLQPTNYYGPSNQTKQKRRHFISKLLSNHVPEAPMNRLSSLLQQSLKWQCHTGSFPSVQRLFQNENDDQDDGKKKKKRKSPNQRFDLILGNVDMIGSTDNKRHKRKSTSTKDGGVVERIPSRLKQTIRMGKKSYIESAIYFPDGRGLVTGSSDGFIEVWGEPAKSGDIADTSPNSLLRNDINYEKLRTSDLSYQKNDELMMQDSSILALAVSNDGTMLASASSQGDVCVWKIADGRLLRKLERTHGGSGSSQGCAVTCLQFSPDGSKVLTGGHDSTCREFGLLSSRMIKEFRGHKSYINCCDYLILPNSSIVTRSEPGAGESDFLAVATGSADGSVIIWNGRTAEPMREIIPPISTSNNKSIHGTESIVSGRNIHTVIHLHSPPNSMVVVPRSDRAFLMSLSGKVLQTFVRDDVQGKDFLTAAVSPSNQWLYIAANDGKCIVFDLNTGKVEKILSSFTEDCIAKKGDSDTIFEISGILHHPHCSFIGGYSNDKAQKRGLLSIFK